MSTCPPVTAYGIFMFAAILYEVFFVKRHKKGLELFAYLIAGIILLWVLCSAGMDIAAWGLLAVPVIFYIFLIAIVIYDQSFNVSSIYAKKPEECPTKIAQKEEECGPDEEPVEDEEECDA